MSDPTPNLTNAPTKRRYERPALVVHGDVQTLTLGKEGPTLDQDGGGSFNPVAADG